MEKRKIKTAGFFGGVLNGLFGSGGGMVVVSAFRKSGLSTGEAHATSVFTTAALSAVSVVPALFNGQVAFGDVLPFLPGGILGSFLAARFFKKIPSGFLKKLFGALLIVSALRMLWGGLR